ncbi:hypothetical protein QA597_11815 [Marinilabiliaceae bacterium ANBcel2]|nr:hypothetical protein [Marinilabiliaceae bacterium ANBcel2]
MLHLIGIGKVGKKILEKAYEAGVNAKLTCIIKNYNRINQMDAPSEFIDFDPEFIKNPASALNLFYGNPANTGYITIAGLGGRGGALLLESLTDFFMNNGIAHYSIGVCPFVFEGTARRQKAIETIQKLQSNPSFTYFDNNLVKEKYKGKINIGEAFGMVDNAIVELIINLTSEENTNPNFKCN